ncbi:hypothetical protein M9M90_03885 [Phenylobacterium sp. LH3H17]|uniref:hypothetical protein n=1 Tax=Phenylobacterium sp. LH3H17 TaxID=2903901 RepID=UPI0020C97A09|nr:hypothetical protein [Phenylobacterium sp. LH3H17]UTP40327.1 hypothetical protein M9M90_03885 [Phenylobacterium sp. LH3H17]
MTTTSAHSPRRVLRPIEAILGAGLLAAVLDIANPIIIWGLKGVPAERILQSVASGLLGKAAFAGGAATAALGMAAHTLIMLGAATVYYLASRRLPAMNRHPWIAGPAFGFGFYFFMNYLVVPLSQAGMKPPHGWFPVLNQMFCHLVLVGLTFSLIISRARKSGDPA